MIKNIKIKTFLVSSFIWILALMTMLGMASIYFTRRLAEQTMDFYESPHTVQLEVAEIRIHMEEISGAIKDAVIYRTPAYTAKTTTIIADTLAEVNEHIELVKSLFTQDNGMLDKADSAMGAWLAQNDKLRSLMEAEEYDQAIALFETDYLAAETGIQNAISEISDSCEKVTLGYYEGAKRSKSVSIIVITSVVAFSIITTILACSAILRSIAIPLLKIRKAADAMAQGDLKHHVGFEGGNEFGQLAKSMDTTVDILSDYVKNISEVLGRLSDKDMTVVVEKDYIGDLAPIKISLGRIADTLNRAMGEISESAELVSAGSEQVAESSHTLSQGASEQASSAQQLSQSISEISDNVRKTAGYTEQTHDLVEQVGAQLEHGNQQMNNMLTAMNEINSASDQIAKIIKTIEDIAFQTNILALNAAVEAARAGAAGKGFAVVADEVRNLAGKSAEAAKSTAVLIQNTIGAVDHGAKIADSTAKTLDEVVSGAHQITDMVAKLADTAEKQAASLEQVSGSVKQITEVVQTNSATSEECAATSEEMSGQAQALRALVKQYKLRSGQHIQVPESVFPPTQYDIGGSNKY